MSKEWFRMKLKKASIYLASFLSLSVMFSICYYLSYQHALNDFNKNAVERKKEYAAIDSNTQQTKTANAADNQTKEVVRQPATTILPTTKYILETYDKKTDTLTSDESNPPDYLVGLTKDEVINYLTEYMKDLTLSEYNKGLISFELKSFSQQQVVLRRSYNEDTVPFRFFVVIKNGYIVVYNSDLKSIFSYTHIEAKTLPEEERIKLSQGIYVDNQEELYSLLESYSS